MSFDMIIFDLDGTLLTAQFELTEKTLKSVQKIRGLGYRVSVATGRSFPSAEPFLKQLNITEPAIFSNGCVFDNPDTGERELLASIPLESALIALMLCDQFALSTKAHLASGKILKSNDTPWPDEGVHFDPGETQTNLKVTLDEDPIKMVFYGEEKKLSSFQDKIEKILGPKAQARLFKSHPYYLEMVNKRVSKGDALKILSSKLGLDLHRMIAVGDQENDYEMLQYCGLGVRVGVSHPRLKEVADHAIPHPEDNGIEELYQYLASKFHTTGPKS